MALSIQERPGGVSVLTPTTEFRASQVVVTAGAWLGKLVPGLHLAPRRIPQYWFRPRDPDSGAFMYIHPHGDVSPVAAAVARVT